MLSLNGNGYGAICAPPMSSGIEYRCIGDIPTTESCRQLCRFQLQDLLTRNYFVTKVGESRSETEAREAVEVISPADRLRKLRGLMNKITDTNHTDIFTSFVSGVYFCASSSEQIVSSTLQLVLEMVRDQSTYLAALEEFSDFIIRSCGSLTLQAKMVLILKFIMTNISRLTSCGDPDDMRRLSNGVTFLLRHALALKTCNLHGALFRRIAAMPAVDIVGPVHRVLLNQAVLLAKQGLTAEMSQHNFAHLVYRFTTDDRMKQTTTVLGNSSADFAFRELAVLLGESSEF